MPTTIPYEVWRISRRIGQLFDSQLIDLGISGADFALYSLLRAGPMTPSEVSRRSGLPATTVSRALQRIEERGHLTRERNPRDGRSSRVVLNDPGAAVHTEGWRRVAPVIDRIDAELGDDAETVLLATIRLDNALRAITGVVTSEEERRLRPSKLHLGVRYEGPPLSLEQEELVREYIDWIRWRRSRPDPTTSVEAVPVR